MAKNEFALKKLAQTVPILVNQTTTTTILYLPTLYLEKLIKKVLLNRCILRWCLNILMSEIERISCGKTFHNFWVATWNDLSPKVVLIWWDGGSSSRSLDDDLNLSMVFQSWPNKQGYNKVNSNNNNSLHLLLKVISFDLST